MKSLEEALKNQSNILKEDRRTYSTQFFAFLVSFYRLFLSGIFGGTCRFYPSCSLYAEQALKEYPAKTAVLLILKRLSRCYPLGGFGFDPVPESSAKEDKYAKQRK